MELAQELEPAEHLGETGSTGGDSLWLDQGCADGGPAAVAEERVRAAVRSEGGAGEPAELLPGGRGPEGSEQDRADRRAGVLLGKECVADG